MSVLYTSLAGDQKIDPLILIVGSLASLVRSLLEAFASRSGKAKLVESEFRDLLVGYFIQLPDCGRRVAQSSFLHHHQIEKLKC